MNRNASKTGTCLLEKPPDKPPETPLEDSAKSLGFSPQTGPHGVRTPLSAAWISDELLQRTRDVWSTVAGREISADEAVEILINVKNLAEFLLDMKQEAAT